MKKCPVADLQSTTASICYYSQKEKVEIFLYENFKKSAKLPPLCYNIGEKFLVLDC